MKNNLIRTIFLVVLVVSLFVLFSGIAPAKDEKRFDAKRRAFCRTMLSHGEQAYARGNYEKAGYYFQKAVQAEPVQMAKSWFKQKGVLLEENTSQGIRPEPPAEGSVPKIKEKEQFHMIIGDDEGC